MARAPVCHVKPNQTDGLPGDQPPPATSIFIPEAIDLASTMAAVNALRRLQYLQMGTGPRPQRPPPGGAGYRVKGDATQTQKQGNWVEQTRQTEKVKVKNKDDPSQFVEVERINSLTMKNPKTGETWVWKREK